MKKKIYIVNCHVSVEFNKGEFRSRPISAFVDNFALSQSECVIGYGM